MDKQEMFFASKNEDDTVQTITNITIATNVTGLVLFLVAQILYGSANLMGPAAFLSLIGVWCFGASLLSDVFWIHDIEVQARALASAEPAVMEIILQTIPGRWKRLWLNLAATAVTGFATLFYANFLGSRITVVNILFAVGMVLFTAASVVQVTDQRWMEAQVHSARGGEGLAPWSGDNIANVAIACGLALFTLGSIAIIFPSLVFVNNIASPLAVIMSIAAVHNFVLLGIRKSRAVRGRNLNFVEDMLANLDPPKETLWEAFKNMTRDAERSADLAWADATGERAGFLDPEYGALGE
mmetsp:Transcript_8569/g.28351  ORF Transcript_8569/g.28351 Transcript_8569/m.28351 type:complete len:298 (+) Transcript_8569:22-915(+)|eukprot:CAMPEP_0170145330 /NCGR_PEP_ID=MMETSP0033_2-20121228/16443_1 /TAXON_ID=195969 /ORGANISM="Dolichomastix tenuilepis, Strain CCMP3274" /LENGTH=297 /DNA_ID=CAMNT_0010381875 /DNA_START=22 /DNA_END=915 /DNA_ORIENTATION=+